MSCEKNDVKGSVSLNLDSLNTAFSLEMKNSLYKGHMTFDGNELITMTFDFPQDIKGLTFEITGESVSVIYENINSSQPKSNLENVFFDLYNGVMLLKNNKEFTQNGEFYEYNGNQITAEIDKNGNVLLLSGSYFSFEF